jgi:hypothetical protein
MPGFVAGWVAKKNKKLIKKVLDTSARVGILKESFCGSKVFRPLE